MLILRIFGVLFFLLTIVRGEVPPSILRSARDAAQELGNQVRAGNVEASILQMYPKWKNRMAKRSGGIAALEEKLKNASEQMQKAGIHIENFLTEPPVIAYEVAPAKILKVEGSEEHISGSKQKWLVFVPTKMTLSVPDPNTGVKHRIETTTFQVAISQKDFLKWSFIDGSSLTVADLRSLFSTLPLNIELPKRARRELK